MNPIPDMHIAENVPVRNASREFMASSERLPSLYSLSGDMLEVLSLLDVAETDDEYADLEEQRIALADKLLQKVESYGAVIRTLEKLAADRKGEADRLDAKAKASKAGAEWLKNRLLEHMETSGQQRIETARFSFAVRVNNPSVNVLDAAAIPNEFKRTRVIVEPDKVGILAHTKATGEVVAGTEVVRNHSLRIS
jgi:hypothetical protein